MKGFFCLWAVLCLQVAHAQTGIKPLTIGDTLPPDLVLTNVLNHPVSEIRLSDLKGKLVILDFWATWCGSCLNSFPHLQSLQNRFKDSLQIILINTQSKLYKDDEQKIRTTLEKLIKRTGTSISLPISYDNPELDGYFPSKALPHEVWINPSGVVCAVTSAREVTEDNIAGILKSIPIKIHQKTDQLSFDSNKPLFFEGNGGSGKELKFRSMITGYIEGIYGIGAWYENGLFRGRYYYNQPLLSLIRAAYEEVASMPDNRIIYDNQDSKLIVNGNSGTKKENLYCYELLLPPSSEKSIKAYMQQDLNRYFGLNIHKDSVFMTALVVKPKSPVLRDPKGNQTLDLDELTLNKHIYNYPLSFAIKLLNNYSEIPIITDMNYDPIIAVDLPFNLNDITGLEKSFDSIGLKIVKEKRFMETILISVKNDMLASLEY